MGSAQLTFYDLSRAYYSAYYLNGFQELAESHDLQVSFSHALPARLAAALQEPAYQTRLFAASVFRLQQGGRELYFCIDAHDASRVHKSPAESGFHLPLLEAVDVYFKVNYNPADIAAATELDSWRDKIRPVSQFMPVRPHKWLKYCRRLIAPPALRGLQPGLEHNYPYAGYLSDARRRILDIKNFKSVQEMRAYRDSPKDIDIYFVTGFHANPRLEETMRSRARIIEALADVTDLHTRVGFASYNEMPEEYAQYAQPRQNQDRHMETLARARVVIYTQGVEGCISSKFALAMSMGIPMIGEPLANNPTMVEANPHLRQQFAWIRPDDIAEHAVELAKNTLLTAELAASNARMFDAQLAPGPTARAILAALLD